MSKLTSHRARRMRVVGQIIDKALTTIWGVPSGFVLVYHPDDGSDQTHWISSDMDRSLTAAMLEDAAAKMRGTLN